MKDMPKSIFLLLLVVPLLLIISTISPGKSDAKSSQIVISDWQFMWDNEQQEVVSPVNLQGRSWLAGISDKKGPPSQMGCIQHGIVLLYRLSLGNILPS